ncbi:MAG: hypothetical protein AAGC81_16815 [Pseudomonadota bacterium]
MIDQLSDDFLRDARWILFWLKLGALNVLLISFVLPWYAYRLPERAGRQRASSNRYFATTIVLFLLWQALEGLRNWIGFIRDDRRYGGELDLERGVIWVFIVVAVMLTVFVASRLFAKPNEFTVREVELDDRTLSWRGWFGTKGTRPISDIKDTEVNWSYWTNGQSKIWFHDGTTLKFPRYTLGGASFMEVVGNRVDRTRPMTDGTGSN